ncbi:hypothetical protein LB553_13485 [Mesorhizobium sp. CA8]|nr:hypothetical protein [Mesorhizobium sp. CA8]
MRSLLGRRPRVSWKLTFRGALTAFCLIVCPKAPLYLTANPDAVNAIELQPGADRIERRIDGFRQVQCRIAGQILGGGGMSAPTSSAGVTA